MAREESQSPPPPPFGLRPVRHVFGWREARQLLPGDRFTIGAPWNRRIYIHPRRRDIFPPYGVPDRDWGTERPIPPGRMFQEEAIRRASAVATGPRYVAVEVETDPRDRAPTGPRFPGTDPRDRAPPPSHFEQRQAEELPVRANVRYVDARTGRELVPVRSPHREGSVGSGEMSLSDDDNDDNTAVAEAMRTEAPPAAEATADSPPQNLVHIRGRLFLAAIIFILAWTWFSGWN